MMLRLLVALAIVAAPAAHALDPGSITFTSLAAARFEITSSASGDAAAKTRQAIDRAGPNATGDGNGIVTQQEIQGYADAFKVYRQAALIGSITSGNLTLDGHRPTSASVDLVDFRGAEGNIASGDSLTLVIDVVAVFAPGAGDTHVFGMTRGASEGQPPQISMTITVPPGYRIASTSGLPTGSYLSADKHSVGFTDDPQLSWAGTIVFTPEPPASTPAPGLALVAVGLLLCVGLLRRVSRSP
ncbi:MAG: hypothetical protein V4510_03260 [bacterium]